MDWQEITVITDAEAEEAVAEIFYRLGSGGVVIEDPRLLKSMAESGKWDAFDLPAGSLERTQHLVIGYLPADADLSGKLEELRAETAETMSRLGKDPGEIRLKPVSEEDWANSWKAYFKPVSIGDRLVVRPTWEEYDPKPGELILDLDPGMAFGTGSHITTVMCARFLEKFLQPGMKMIDVGTGTGILAMSAVRLGAKDALALDYDAVAVRVAHENICLNGLEERIEVRQNDLLQGVTEQADLITANIIADVIIRLLPQAKERLPAGGLLIVSGIIGERRDDVYAAGLREGFELLAETQEEDWAAQVWRLAGS